MLAKLKDFIRRHEALYGSVFFVRNLKEEIYSFWPWVSDEHFDTAEPKPLHGDTVRQELVRNILKVMPVTSIVETGTYKGATANFFAQNFSGPIFTCEVMGLYFRGSRRRLKKYSHVHIMKMSSPRMLDHLENGHSFGTLPFFFLDAHWYNYWPILDELRIIKKLSSALIMIDDFEVPGRPELGYDVQMVDGKEIKNNLEFIQKELLPNDKIFFPISAGIYRGYVIIFRGAADKFSRLENSAFFMANYKKHEFSKK